MRILDPGNPEGRKGTEAVVRWSPGPGGWDTVQAFPVRKGTVGCGMHDDRCDWVCIAGAWGPWADLSNSILLLSAVQE